MSWSGGFNSAVIRNDLTNPPLPRLAGALLSVGQILLNRPEVDKYFVASVAECSLSHSLLSDYESAAPLQFVPS